MANEWRAALDDGRYPSQSYIAKRYNVTRARVSQILALLRLTPPAQDLLKTAGDTVPARLINERKLRPIIDMMADEQREAVASLVQRVM